MISASQDVLHTRDKILYLRRAMETMESRACQGAGGSPGEHWRRGLCHAGKQGMENVFQ
jgi:hypothetical protein